MEAVRRTNGAVPLLFVVATQMILMKFLGIWLMGVYWFSLGLRCPLPQMIWIMIKISTISLYVKADNNDD